MILSADFETTTSETHTEVWLAGFANVKQPEVIYQQLTIDDFFRELVDYVNEYETEGETIVFFHNLKFDGSFMLNFLLSKGFEPETFINDMGVWYSISLELDVKITFRDSLKVLPLKLANIAKMYNLPSKGETPLLPKRPSTIKPEWLSYHARDIEILAKALYDIFFVQNYEKFTNASQALMLFQQSIGGEDSFRELFPILSKDDDAFCRKAYRGGWSYANPKYTEMIITEPIDIWDKNSMYPGVMLEYKLPYGQPTKSKTMPKGLWIAKAKARFKLKPKGFSVIHATREMALILGCSGNDYVPSSKNQWFEIYLTNYDYELYNRAYDIEYQFEEFYGFKSKKGFFKDYIETFREMKENAKTPGERTYAKAMLNSLYGKFGSKIIQQQKIPYLDGCLKFKDGEKEEVKPVYVPMACFITSIARWEIGNDAMDNYEDFRYCDTDSLHLISHNTLPNLKIHSSHFGYWKNEGKSIKSKYLRAKLYMEEIITDSGTEISVKGAGMNDDVKAQVTFENFRFGQEFTGKRMQRQIKGGVHIYNSTFKIRRKAGIF